MARTKATPGVKAYYEALQRVFELQSEVLTAALPHMGERGRNDEERFRDFLSKTLPRKFSIGTGFVVCSDPSVPQSNQNDIVVFDEATIGRGEERPIFDMPGDGMRYTRDATGIDTVIVNGEVAYADGKYADAKSGVVCV